MVGEIQKIRRYIELTPPSKYNDRYTVRAAQLIEVVNMAVSDRVGAVTLAYDYGKAQGLRMGRREARG